MTDLDNPHSWKLKGQGNANVVFAYTGNCQWLVGNVLRVRKTAQNADTATVVLHPTESLEARIWSPLIPQSISGAAERQTAYEEAVLRQLLGAQYIHTCHPCQLSTEFAAALSAQLQSAYRSLSCRACLLPDHAVFRQCADSKRLCTESSARGLEGKAAYAVRRAERNDEAGEVSTGIHHAGTLCVEIKPKCGFLPASPLIRPEHEVKKRVPRFQLHQRLKLAQGKIKHLSNYNPLDLFSGEPQKVEAALAAMFEQPQNNLQLFLDGSPMQLPQDDRLPSLQRLAEVQRAGGLQGLIRLLRIILLREGVLDRILKVQKMDVHDIEGICPLLAALLQRHAPASLSEDTPLCRQGAPCASSERAAPNHGKPGPTNVHGYVDRAEAAATADRSDKQSEHRPTKRSEESGWMVATSGAAPGNEIRIETHMASQAGCRAPAGNAFVERDAALERLLSADFETAADAIRGYLVAATAKDCSLMITLAPCLPGSAPSGDSRYDSSAAAAVSRAVAEIDCCAETSSRKVASSAAGISQPLGELDGCDSDQCAMTGSEKVAAGIAQAAAMPMSIGQEWASSSEHAVGGITGTSAAQKFWVSEEWLPSKQEDPSAGAVVQHAETGAWFRYKVAIVDLDLKPLSKVEQHFRLDQQILDCVLRTSSSAAPGTQ